MRFLDELPEPESTSRGPRSRPQSTSKTLWHRLGILVRLRKLYLLSAEIRFAPTEAQRLFILTVIIGSFCGLAAVAFHLTIKGLDHLLIDRAMDQPGDSWIAWTLVTPTVGGVVCGILLRYVVPKARGSGIPQVRVAFATKGRISTREAVGKFFIGALQLGSGASLGREGPTVHICAGIASGLGRLAGVSPKSMRRLLPVGAAAGIAAAFNAPIAAVTFTIEEIVGKLDQTVLSGVIIAAALAAVIERSVLGEHPVFDVPQTYGLHHVSSLLIYAILGVAAAIVSVTFTDTMLKLRLRARTSRIPVWAQPGVGGLVTGILAVVAWKWLGTRGVTGGGYAVLADALTGNLAIKVMLALCVMKILATASSYASGGAGGIFAPTLFIGGTLGGAVGELDHVLLHHDGEPLGAFALVGMGAVFSGTIRAPMTSVLIIIEMTGGYSLILPLMIANMTAYVLARHWRPMPIYEALLAQDGIHLADSVVHDALEELPLRRLPPHGPFLSFAVGTHADEVAESARREPKQDVYPVVDTDERVVGIIRDEEVKLLAEEPQLLPLVNAADMMIPAVTVSLDTDLGHALEVMIKSGLTQLPITDDRGRCVGFVSEGDIAKAYLQGQRPRAGAEAEGR
jgi:chloride channel protein, CIC family